jgi:translation initiation factor 1
MAKDWKDRLGVVYSTNPEFNFTHGENETRATLPPKQQNLLVQLDRKKRKGKVVTLIKGFIGSEEDIKSLGRELKIKCCTGGSVSDGEILIQGDFSEKVIAFLLTDGYRVKRSGGR